MSSNFYGRRFAQTLQDIRKERGMSQQDLAAELKADGLNLHFSAIGKIEQGDRRVSIDEAIAFARALQVPINRLLNFHDSFSAAITAQQQSWKGAYDAVAEYVNTLLDVALIADSSATISEQHKSWLASELANQSPGGIALRMHLEVKHRIEREGLEPGGEYTSRLLEILRSDSEILSENHRSLGAED